MIKRKSASLQSRSIFLDFLLNPMSWASIRLCTTDEQPACQSRARWRRPVLNEELTMAEAPPVSRSLRNGSTAGNRWALTEEDLVVHGKLTQVPEAAVEQELAAYVKVTEPVLVLAPAK